MEKASNPLGWITDVARPNDFPFSTEVVPIVRSVNGWTTDLVAAENNSLVRIDLSEPWAQNFSSSSSAYNKITVLMPPITGPMSFTIDLSQMGKNPKILDGTSKIVFKARQEKEYFSGIVVPMQKYGSVGTADPVVCYVDAMTSASSDGSTAAKYKNTLSLSANSSSDPVTAIDLGVMKLTISTPGPGVAATFGEIKTGAGQYTPAAWKILAWCPPSMKIDVAPFV